MSRNSAERKLKLVLALLLVAFIASAVLTGIHTYRSRIANEEFEDIDVHSMHEFSEINSMRALEAIKAGNTAKLAKLMINSEGVDKIMTFAEWSGLDLDGKISMGSGSLSSDVNKDGKMDVSEKFVVENSDGKYVFFIETMTSRWGRKNDGISAISVTTYENFENSEFAWNGETDDQTATAGKLFWTGNQK